MAIWENFEGLHVPYQPPTVARPRFSLTSDILSYRKCPRQYRFFGNDGFVPARSTQAFYGTIIHQVLDRCHRLYRGLVPGRPFGTLASDEDIATYFLEVRNALQSHGVRAASDDVADQAEEVIKNFNAIEGPTLYPRVHDTEFRLESDRRDYVLRGVVDVIARAEDVERIDQPLDPGTMEIWDYKGSKRLGRGTADWKNYEWQMLVYAELYRLRTDAFPARAVVYFMNELEGVNRAKGRPQFATLDVTITEERVREALTRFDADARAIMQHRRDGNWPTPLEPPDTKTCNACDVRYSCPTVNLPGPPVYPIRNPFERARRAGRRKTA